MSWDPRYTLWGSWKIWGYAYNFIQWLQAELDQFTNRPTIWLLQWRIWVARFWISCRRFCQAVIPHLWLLLLAECWFLLIRNSVWNRSRKRLPKFVFLGASQIFQINIAQLLLSIYYNSLIKMLKNSYIIISPDLYWFCYWPDFLRIFIISINVQAKNRTNIY